MTVKYYGMKVYNTSQMTVEMSYTAEFDLGLQKELEFLRGLGFDVTVAILFGSLSNKQPRMFPKAELIQFAKEQQTDIQINPLGPEDDRHRERIAQILACLEDIPEGTLDTDADLLFICSNADQVAEVLKQELNQKDLPQEVASLALSKSYRRSYPVIEHWWSDACDSESPFTPRIPRADILIADQSGFNTEFNRLRELCSPNGIRSSERLSDIRKATFLIQAVRHGTLVYGQRIPDEVYSAVAQAELVLNNFMEKII